MSKKSGLKKQKTVRKSAPVVIPARPAKKSAKPAVKALEASAVTAKSVAEALARKIEKRKLEKASAARSSPFGKMPVRRGRRPKRLAEYTPSNNEEESLQPESDYEALQYDTGIRVKDASDDNGLGGERFDDFDEELNFDR